MRRGTATWHGSERFGAKPETNGSDLKSGRVDRLAALCRPRAARRSEGKVLIAGLNGNY